jgi:hypothetical protein
MKKAIKDMTKLAPKNELKELTELQQLILIGLKQIDLLEQLIKKVK